MTKTVATGNGPRRFALSATAAAVLVSVVVLSAIVVRAIDFYSLDRPHDTPEISTAALIVGTLMVALLSLAIAIPTSIAAGIHLSEFSSSRRRQVLKPMIEVLSGIPPIVYGFLAVVIIGPGVALFIPTAHAHAGLAAAIAIALMVAPTLTTLIDDALVAVPRNIRESASALGGNRLEVIRHVLLPYIAPNIVAATLLVLARALGESVIVLLLADSLVDSVSWNPLRPVATITSHALRVTELFGSDEYLFASAFPLLAGLAIASFLAHHFAARMLATRGER